MLQEIADNLPADIKYNIAAYALPIKFAIKRNMIWVFTILEQEDYTKNKAKIAWKSAVKYGRIQILKLLMQKKIRYPGQLSVIAAKYPRLDILKFCYSLKPNHEIMIHDDEIDASIKQDNLENFEYLIQLPSFRALVDDKEIINLIIFYRSCRILKWILDNLSKLFTSPYLYRQINVDSNNLISEITNGQLNVFIYSVKSKLILADISFGDCDHAIACIINKIYIHSDCMEAAVSRGNLLVVQLLEHYMKINPKEYLIHAATYGHMNILKHYQKDVSLSLVQDALCNGKMKIARWIKSLFPITESEAVEFCDET